MDKTIYLETSEKRIFEVKANTGIFGKIKLWGIRTSEGPWHKGHPNITSIKDFEEKSLPYVAQGTGLFPELYGPGGAQINDILRSEKIESILELS